MSEAGAAKPRRGRRRATERRPKVCRLVFAQSRGGRGVIRARRSCEHGNPAASNERHWVSASAETTVVECRHSRERGIQGSVVIAAKAPT